MPAAQNQTAAEVLLIDFALAYLVEGGWVEAVTAAAAAAVM
jgi:hypothetical protein